MQATFKKLEQRLFRNLNSVVDPAVRSGLASSALTPASLIVVESTGHRSGQTRSTPLWSAKVGKYRVISTVRGKRSFWLKNLAKTPELTYYIDGKAREAKALVFGPDLPAPDYNGLPLSISVLAATYERLARRGMGFAILAPAET